MSALTFAVIGAGPAGMFAAEEILARLDGARVDVIDRLPTPWGLVRHGIAPDHQQMKAVTRVFERTFRSPDIRFVGGVDIGVDVGHDQLLQAYDAVVYCTGAPVPRRTQINGSALDGVTTAGSFVTWYNGHPDSVESTPDLSGNAAVIVGMGNAALDCARVLLSRPGSLETTDIANHALEALRRSRVSEVSLLARRGPDKASMTPAMLADTLRALDVDVDVSGTDLLEDDQTSSILRTHLQHRDRRGTSSGRRLHLAFNTRPLEYVGTSKLRGVRVQGMTDRDSTRVRDIPCSIAIEAIGFVGRPLEGLPFDDTGSTVANVSGRVAPKVYVAGWAKRGANGVVGINKKCARDTVQAIIADIDSGALVASSDKAELTWPRTVVNWTGWKRLDQHEIDAGVNHGRPRVKVVRAAEQLAIAHQHGDGFRAQCDVHVSS
jgi:ferredoxin--NADP+ reductase